MQQLKKMKIGREKPKNENSTDTKQHVNKYNKLPIPACQNMDKQNRFH